MHPANAKFDHRVRSAQSYVLLFLQVTDHQTSETAEQNRPEIVNVIDSIEASAIKRRTHSVPCAI